MVESKAEAERLRTWLKSQSRLFREGSLPPDRSALLNEIPQWKERDQLEVRNESGDGRSSIQITTRSTPRSLAAWMANLDLLKQFRAREGHAQVPTSHLEAGLRLGSWVNSQRNAYRAGRLQSQQVDVLEGVDGWTWNARDARWEEMRSLVIEFRKAFGHVDIPRSYSVGCQRLGNWVSYQRVRFHSGRLEPQRIKRLEAIDGWKWIADA